VVPSSHHGLRNHAGAGRDELDRAEGNGHVVVAPYPVAIRDGRASITARLGAKYQVLIDGRRIVDVESKGSDVVELR
jgi:hypothetical protein